MLIGLLTTAADWPTYLQNPQRTATNASETIIAASNAAQLTKLWSFKTGGPIAASPTVVSGIAYIGSWDGYEYALDATTGALKWRTYLGVTNAPGCTPAAAGITSTATVDSGVVYVGGGDSYWYALDAATGAVLWRVFTGDTSSGHYNWSSPALYKGYAYIGVASMGDCPLVQGQLLQVSLASQQVVNVFKAVPDGQVGGGIWTSPSVDPTTNTIFVTTGTPAGTGQPFSRAVVALDADTLAVKSSWKLPESEAIFDSDFSTTPTLFSDSGGNPLLVTMNKNGFAYAFNRLSLAAGPIWQKSIALGGDCPTCGDGSVSSGAFGNGTLYLAGGNTIIDSQGYPGSVRAVDPGSGDFLWEHGDPQPVFPALAYANGLLIASTGSLLEVLNATDGTRLYSFSTAATVFGAASIANGTIFASSTDGTVFALALPPGPPPAPPRDPSCPRNWGCWDIGGAVPAGSEAISYPDWSVTAGGSGVGGNSDQFRLVATPTSGNSQVSARLVSQQNTGAGAQAGLMMRQRTDPGSPFYALFLTAGGRLVAQYRTAFGGATATANTVVSGALPIFVELQRTGDQLQAATSTDGVSYTLVPGATVTFAMPATVLSGLAVSSGVNGSAGTDKFSAVRVGGLSAAPSPARSSTPCPISWSCADVGNPALVGDQTRNGNTWTLRGAGGDIWGYSDQFHYVWRGLSGDGSVSAQVTSQTNTDVWAKAGVMLRLDSGASASYYAALVTPANGISVQYRSVRGFSTKQFRLSGTAPIYVMVARSGSEYTAYISSDGSSWTPVLGSTVSLASIGSALAGIAVTSHNASAIGTAVFSNVSINTTAPPPPTACPTSWSCADIGAPALTGYQTLSGGSWSVSGSGGDVWGVADQFHYVAQSLASDGSVDAQVASQTNTDPWAKAGVMLRLSGDPGSPYYFAMVTPGNGVNVQYRASQGGSASSAGSVAGTPPVYLRVTRVGTSFTAYYSSDGSTWNLIAGSTVTINMTGTLLAGMAVTSHTNSAISTATFNNVSINTTAPPPPTACPTGWSCADIGAPALTGYQTLSGGSWSVSGSGGDVWGVADQFHYVSQSLPSEGSVGAHVLSQTNTSPWAKAGVMLRLSTDPGSPYYFAMATPGNGINVQYRASQGGAATSAVNLAGAPPVYLRVTRVGTTFTAYSSSDGVSWNPVAGSTVTINMTGTLLAGMAVTSHGSAISTATFNNVSINTTAPPPPTACPTGWSCADIGAPALTGYQTLSGGSWSVSGSGGDIWGTADQFRYVYQSLTSDGSVDARLLTQTNTDPWAKAGVMLRLSSDPGSPYYFAMVTPGNGINVQYRASQGGAATSAFSMAGTLPVYLRVTRVGTTFTAYSSSDGVSWSPILGSTVTINMTGTLLAGMAVTSHNTLVLSTASFDSVTIG